MTEKQQEIIDYLNKGFYLHLNEYIPFNQKTKKQIFFIKENQVNSNDIKLSIKIDQNAAKTLVKNKIVKEIEYHIHYTKTFILNN